MEIIKELLIRWSPLVLILIVYLFAVYKMRKKQDESKAELIKQNELMEKLLTVNTQLLNKIENILKANSETKVLP